MLQSLGLQSNVNLRQKFKDVFVQIVANCNFLKIKLINSYFSLKTFEMEFIPPHGNFFVDALIRYKVGCVFTMVISSEFRVGQYRDDDHRVDASHFMFRQNQFCCSKVYFEY